MPHPVLGDRQDIARIDAALLHADVVDLDAVAALQVADVPVAAIIGQLGVMGGDIQAQGHSQVLINLVDREMDLQQAIDAPRVRYISGKGVMLEDTLPANVIDGLECVGPLKTTDDIVTSKLDLTSGAIDLPPGPGLGVTLDEGKLARYRYA